MNTLVRAGCLVLPSGETHWFEAQRGDLYVRAILLKWQKAYPELADTGATVRMAIIDMPFEKLCLAMAQNGEWATSCVRQNGA